MQLVASMYSVVLCGVVMVVGSNFAGGKIFTASIGSVDSLYLSLYIYIFMDFRLNVFQITTVIVYFNWLLIGPYTCFFVNKDQCFNLMASR